MKLMIQSLSSVLPRPVVRILVAMLAFACPAKSLLAATLWGANWGGQLCCYQLSTSEIDVATGAVFPAVTIPGTGSRAGVLDFASDPIGNPSVIWSVNYTFESGYRLQSFNPHQKQLLSSTQLDNTLTIRGLAIDPTSGILYGTSPTALYTIAPSTGVATLIGPTSLRVDGALGFDSAGSLFGVTSTGGINPVRALVSVNKLTGATSKQADIDTIPADLAESPDDGKMYGLGYGNDPSGEYSLYQIDVSTGVASNVHFSLFRPSGLAFTGIPEPSVAVLWSIAACTIALLRGRNRG